MPRGRRYSYLAGALSARYQVSIVPYGMLHTVFRDVDDVRLPFDSEQL
jgi:hypothetical protein